jgi:hypothetical protein
MRLKKLYAKCPICKSRIRVWNKTGLFFEHLKTRMDVCEMSNKPAPKENENENPPKTTN